MFKFISQLIDLWVRRHGGTKEEDIDLEAGIVSVSQSWPGQSHGQFSDRDTECMGHVVREARRRFDEKECSLTDWEQHTILEQMLPAYFRSPRRMDILYVSGSPGFRGQVLVE